MDKLMVLALIMSLLLAPGVFAADQNYINDDGVSETALGGSLGDAVRLTWFDPVGGSEVITHISATFGTPVYPGSGPPEYTYIYVYIWDDPNNDGDPTDAVYLGYGGGYVDNPDTDFFQHFPLIEPVTVTSRYFVGVETPCESLCWPNALDVSTPSNGQTWSAHDDSGFNPYDLTDNSTPPVDISGTYNGVWMLRAHRLSPDVDCHSFDYPTDRTRIYDWTEQEGDWWARGRQLASESTTVNQVITRDASDLTDGCVEFNGSYGAGASVRYVGAVVRYISPTDRILVKLQDNSGAGYFNLCIIYDDSTPVYTAGANYGTDPKVQVEFAGTQMHVRVDVERDGSWDHDYPVTVTSTHAGAVGLAAYDECFFDDWCSSSSPDDWGGTLIDFQNVPQTYWYHGGNQNLGTYYDGLTFSPDVTVFETTVYGYSESAYPYHSSDAVVSNITSAETRIDFDEEKTHVGLWFTSANGDSWAEAYNAGGTLVDREVMLNNSGRNNYVSLDGVGIRYVTIDSPRSAYTTLDDIEYQPANSPPASTIDASFTCSPQSGTLPLQVSMNAELTNLYGGMTRRIAGCINVRLANNTTYTNWRVGFTNVAPLDSYTSSWMQNLPALGSLVGSNNFTLVAEDVTPAPYNQPPFPASGDAAVKACIITAAAP